MYSKQVTMQIDKIIMGCDTQLPQSDMGGHLSVVGRGSGGFPHCSLLNWNLKDRRNRPCEEVGRAFQAKARGSAKAQRLESPWCGRCRKDGCVSGQEWLKG